MTGSRTSGARCDDCGARTESTAAWNRPSGVSGSSLYLCTRCWWARAVHDGAIEIMREFVEELDTRTSYKTTAQKAFRFAGRAEALLEWYDRVVESAERA